MTTKSEATPTPWRADHEQYGGKQWVIYGGPDGSVRMVATVWATRYFDAHTGEAEGEANARLIAAAPEMFKELLWMADQYDDSQTATTLAGRLYDVSCTAKKLIALARGES